MGSHRGRSRAQGDSKQQLCTSHPLAPKACVFAVPGAASLSKSVGGWGDGALHSVNLWEPQTRLVPTVITIIIVSKKLKAFGPGWDSTGEGWASGTHNGCWLEDPGSSPVPICHDGMVPLQSWLAPCPRA